MNILCCVKRVPMTGGRIVLTLDEQAIETRHLGFTISPHEECGVEEAVRLIEAGGGSSTVLTLGPPEAEEQLRDMMALREYVDEGPVGKRRLPILAKPKAEEVEEEDEDDEEDFDADEFASDALDAE